ncbi:DUF2975 domain-containing protein [Novosphingobium album (ex Hu et al. 2023)]|uniref:DUF2975 domain-containing protein n=1 Tax=Novosphingobium album (ex Hu et al. 2023) TaxID=2930093 RepID=A0ABT0B5U0_9SPHN|nr:DUF2975 domain-containing protein [Novosphingobium album (ex Hu et al. 2023)]MCJ2180409.1 DUF2975 domain-containing protein [Novosphingobium album (ex Hu et al. 2023)]
MTSITRDPLLAAAKGILWFLMGVMVVGATACLAGIPIMLVLRGKIMAELATQAPGLVFGQFYMAIVALCLLGAGLLVLLFRIFQLLKQIVGTVGEGDPFVPENARRLTRMAWLTLAVQIIALPITGIATWIHKLTEGVRDSAIDVRVEVDGGFNGNGLLLMLILFILARVFRKGAEMRAELEGTV